MRGTTPERTRIVMRYHTVNPPSLLIQIVRSPLSGCIERRIHLLARGALTYLDTYRHVVTVANMPRLSVTGHDLIDGAPVRPVAYPLSHCRVVSRAIPVGYVVPRGSSGVRCGVDDKITRGNGAVAVRDEIVNLLPSESRRCADHQGRRKRDHGRAPLYKLLEHY